jgi:hypothetical protein
MSAETKFAKQRLLDQFSSQKAAAGHALNTRVFFMNEVQRWDPKQQDALDSAIDELVSEGLIENRDGTPFLTEKGVDHLYPEVGNSVRDAILRYFASSGARAGHAFNTRAFMQTVYSGWNPKQKEALEVTCEKLIADGLVEESGDNLLLTDKGYGAIY